MKPYKIWTSISDEGYNQAEVIECKRVGYAANLDEVFVYWTDEDDVLYCLGQHGKFQVCFVEEVNLQYFVDLGEL